MEFSPEVQEQIRQKVEQARTGLEAQKNELRNQPGNEELKRDVAEKLGLATTLLIKYELGAIPSPQEALELFERLEENIPPLVRLFEAVVGAVKAIVQGIIDILTFLVDGIRGLFPEQETRTAFVPDRDPLSEGVVTFGLVSDVDAEGLLTVPAVFAGTPEALSVPYVPCHSSFSVRVRPVSPSQACLQVESFSSTSRPIEQRGLRLPAFLQSLDSRRPSIGMLDLGTGEVSGRVYSRLTDGRLYTARSPVLIRSDFTGRMHFDAGILRLRTHALDVAGDLPLRRVLRGESC